MCFKLNKDDAQIEISNKNQKIMLATHNQNTGNTCTNVVKTS